MLDPSFSPSIKTSIFTFQFDLDLGLLWVPALAGMASFAIFLNCRTLAYPLVCLFIPVMTILNRLFSFSSSANLSPCLQELRRALGYTNQAIKGRFKPLCKLDGSYEEMQCLVFGARDETCWCVDSDGKELIGTRVPGKASCVPEMGRQCFYRRSRKIIATL